MERYIPVSSEILTRVILLYEKEFKNGLRIWKKIEDQGTADSLSEPDTDLFFELGQWMEQLRGIFENTEPYREKEKWIDDQIHLN